MRIEIQENGWDKPFMKVVLDPDMKASWIRSAWEEFKKRVDSQLKVLEKSDNKMEKQS